MRTARTAVWAAVVAACLAARTGEARAGGGPAAAGKPGPATGTVSGIVTDQDGKPLAGATAEVRREGSKDVARATSDAKGFYAVRGLVPGKATVVVRAKGRIAVRHEVDVPATGLAVADAKLLPGVRFAGRVVDTRGAGVGGVRILAFQSGGGQGLGDFFAMARGDATRSGADGTYELDGIAPGQAYTLRFVHPRYQTVDLPGLDATPGGGHDALEAVLEDAAWVTGTVVGTDGKPIAGAAVSCGDDPFSVGGGAGWLRFVMSLVDEDATPPTDARGRFSVGSIAEPTATIAVRAEGHFPATVEVKDLVPGQEKGGVVVTLETATAVIEGLVLDDVGGPVAGAQVTAWHDGEPVASAVSDATGRYRLQHVASKEPVEVLAHAGGHEPGQATEVALDAKEANVTLRRLGRLTLRVLGPDGKPVPRVLVRTLVSEGDAQGGQRWVTQGSEPITVELPIAGLEVAVEAQGCARKTVGKYSVDPGGAYDAGTVTLEKKEPGAPDEDENGDDG